jgi:hypothetical protein
MRLDPLRTAVAALALGPNVAFAPFRGPPPDRARRSDAKSLRRCPTDNPPSIAPTTRLRRSRDKDLAMHAGLLRRQKAIRPNPIRESPDDSIKRENALTRSPGKTTRQYLEARSLEHAAAKRRLPNSVNGQPAQIC